MAGFLRSNSLISSAIFRVSARSHAPAARPSAVFTRFFATAHEHDDAEEMQKWRNISIAAIIACTALAVYNFSGEQHHEASEHPIVLLQHSSIPTYTSGTRNFHGGRMDFSSIKSTEGLQTCGILTHQPLMHWSGYPAVKVTKL